MLIPYIGELVQMAQAAPSITDPDSLVTFNAVPVVDAVFETAKLFVAGASILLSGFLPGWIGTIFYRWKLNAMIENAVLASLMKIRDSVKSKLPAGGTITFDVKNAVVDDALQTILNTVSKWTLFMAGGQGQLATMIKAWVEQLVTSTSTVYTESPKATPVPAKVITQPVKIIIPSGQGGKR